MILTQHTEQQSQVLNIISNQSLQLALQAQEYRETTDNAEDSLIKKVMTTIIQC